MSDPVSGIGIVDTCPRGMITLRGDLLSDECLNVVNGITGEDPPGPLAIAGNGLAVWMSPDELLLLSPYSQVDTSLAVDRQIAALSAALAGHHALILDVSDARTVFRLTGARVGEVLAKGTPCDCSDRGFPSGMARRTHLAGLAVAIWRLDAETWEIACFRSYAHHLKAWLETASAPAAAVYP